jgi:hypothetical protein
MAILTVHIKEIGTIAPDIICLRVRDPEIEKGPLVNMGAAQGTLGAFVTRTHPVKGVSWAAKVVGKNADHLRFMDVMPTVFIDRAAADVPGNYTITNTARTVTQVWRTSLPYDQGRCNNATNNGYNSWVSLEHCIYLKLSGAIEAGAHTISIAGNTFPAAAFTFNDKSTRCLALKTNQQGFRPVDTGKLAVLTQWIPGNGNRGAVNFVGDYGALQFYVIDDAGTPVWGPGNVVERSKPWTYEETGNQSMYTYQDFSKTPVQMTAALSKTNPVVCTAAAHEKANGRLVFFHCLGVAAMPSGVHNLEAIRAFHASTSDADFGIMVRNATANTFECWRAKAINRIVKGTVTTVYCTAHNIANGGTAHFGVIQGMTELSNTSHTVTRIDANTFTIAVDSTGFGNYECGAVASAGFDGTSHVTHVLGGMQTIPGFQVADAIYDAHVANRSATYVYYLDFGTFVPTDTAKTYRLWIPGFGVSDPFRVHDAIYAERARNAMQGYYNQCFGLELDPAVGGVARPANYADGVNGCIIYESLLCATFSGENNGAPNIGGLNVVAGHAAGRDGAPLLGPRVVGWKGGWSDAGDWDQFNNVHMGSMCMLLQIYLRLPKPARDLDTGFPKSSALWGVPYDTDSDVLGDTVHMVLWYFESRRRWQKPDGRVYSGLSFTGGGGGDEMDPSYLHTQQGAVLAADVPGNFSYAQGAALLALAFREAGLMSLADLWYQSGKLAFTWADTIYTSQRDKVNNTGDQGAARDAYYRDTIHMDRAPVGVTKNFGSYGSGVHYISAVDTALDTVTIDGPNVIGMATGTRVSVHVGTGALPGGLTQYGSYFINRSGSTVKFYDTAANATANGATGLVNLTAGFAAGAMLYRIFTDAEFEAALLATMPTALTNNAAYDKSAAKSMYRYTSSFRPVFLLISTNIATDMIEIEAGHGIVNGDRVSLAPRTGALPGGVSVRTVYWAGNVSGNFLSLHTSEALALAGTTKVNLTTVHASGAILAPNIKDADTLFWFNYSERMPLSQTSDMYEAHPHLMYPNDTNAGASYQNYYLYGPAPSMTALNNRIRTDILNGNGVGQYAQMFDNSPTKFMIFRHGSGGNYFAPNGGFQNYSMIWPMFSAMDENPPDDPFLKLLQQFNAYALGANQMGLTTMTGIGRDDELVSLIRDREAMGIASSDWPGVGVYVWDWNMDPSNVFSNFGADGNFIAMRYTNESGLATGKHKVIQPHRYARPVFEQFWANTYCVYNTEFTTEQGIVPWYGQALALHAWDGNTITDLDDGGPGPTLPPILARYGGLF